MLARRTLRNAGAPVNTRVGGSPQDASAPIMERRVDVGVQRSFMCPVLIGRDSVLERAQRLLGEDARGNRAMLIAAEAGLGKSRLVAVIKAVAATDGFLIREGACFLQDRAEPYASLVDAVRARFAGLPPKE